MCDSAIIIQFAFLFCIIQQICFFLCQRKVINYVLVAK